ncbi:MAG: S1 RNA-binding domain-containing protein [Candidatus Margulisiibacteriota bacterium]
MEEEKSTAAPEKQELSGTAIRSIKERAEFSELDSLIAETLSESKASVLGKEPVKEEFALSGTRLSKEFIKETPKVPEMAKEIPLKQPEPIQQEEIKASHAPSAPQDQYDKTFKTYKAGDVIKGTVVNVGQTGALIDIQYQSDGFISSEELGDQPLHAGDGVDVYIIALSNKEGYVELSLKRAAVEKKWKALYDAFRNKTALEAKVSSAVAGGLVADLGGIRGFIPASQVLRQQGQQLSDFVDQTIPVKVLEIDHRQNKVILSHRQGNFEKQQLEREKFFGQIEMGQVLRGKVSGIKKFGVFVNVNGVEGLIHLNDISWKRIDDASKMFSAGQEIDVFVIGVDHNSKKVSFGLKQLQADPWEKVPEKYKPGQIVEVKVLRLAKFGAFVELEEGIEGLIHNTELSIKGVQNPSEAVKPMDVIKAKILRVEESEQKIGLSIKEIQLDEQEKQFQETQQTTGQQKVTIGDTVSDSIKEQLSSQNELSQSA